MDLEKEWRGELLPLLVLWGIVISFLLLLTGAGWPEYWKYVAAETTPLTWLESVLLVLTAFVASLIAYIEGKTESHSWRKTVLGWLIVALAFAWLAMDERFALHERLRDRFLKPTGIRLLPWMEAGDWLIPIYTLCGLAAVWGIWKLIGARKVARRFFVAALLLSVCAVGMDTIDVRSLDKGMERLLQSIEEGVETVAMTSFLSTFLCVWMGKMRMLLGGTS